MFSPVSSVHCVQSLLLHVSLSLLFSLISQSLSYTGLHVSIIFTLPFLHFSLSIHPSLHFSLSIHGPPYNFLCQFKPLLALFFDNSHLLGAFPLLGVFFVNSHLLPSLHFLCQFTPSPLLALFLVNSHLLPSLHFLCEFTPLLALFFVNSHLSLHFTLSIHTSSPS